MILPRRSSRRRVVPEVRKHIAATLKAGRMSVHLSQLAFAKRAGVSAAFLNEIERGTKALTSDTLWMLMMALRRAGSPITFDVLFPTLPNPGVSAQDDFEGPAL